MINTFLLNQCFHFDEGRDFLEYCNAPSTAAFIRWKNSLQPDVRLFLAVDNKKALRYDCGDYPDGPCFTKDEICKFLEEAGLQYRCYCVYPCLEYPQLVYADGYLPNEELIARYFPKYNHPEAVFEIEEFLIDGLVPKGDFHQKANAFLFVCGSLDNISELEHITLSADRTREKAFATLIYSGGTVVKQAMYPEGINHLKSLNENMNSLKKHGIKVVPGHLDGDSYIMPYVRAPLATTYMKEVLRENKGRYVALMDRLVELITMSSDHVEENEDGVVLARGYLDMVPLNAFFINGDFQFFDQEFYLENCPVKAIIYRALLIPYCGDDETNKMCPWVDMLERYGLLERIEYWYHYTDDFLKSLRDQEQWKSLQNKHGRNDTIMKGNKRIRYMKAEHNCFSEIRDRKICVFGTGRFADKFVDMYHHDYSIIAAVDNDETKQGTIWKGMQVCAPEILCENKDWYVMVCVKDSLQIMEQLRLLGVEHSGVYDAHCVYPGRQACDIPYTGKPYHIGYCAGVYDLFHIGHVNIFRRAKEMCDYLIVGVVTDEGVRNNKHREPFIPYEERVEMVRCCRYVDEAVEIPYIYCRTPDMFEKYHFDVQFSGSDYEHDPGWLMMKQYLNDHGAEMVFFPYTEATSSTKIKGLIEKGLTE